MAEDLIEEIFHIEQIISRLNIHRSDETCSLTDQFGYVKFGDEELKSNIRLSQYLRLALKSDARKVVEYLRSGGGQRCRMSTHLRKTFQRGLVAAAATTNDWLITSGMNSDVIKEVGEALNNDRCKNIKHGLEIPFTVEPLYTGTSITRAPRLYGHSAERPIDFCWKLTPVTRAPPTSESGHCFLAPAV